MRVGLLFCLALTGCNYFPTYTEALPHLAYKGRVDLVTAQQVEFGEAEYDIQRACVGWRGHRQQPLSVEVFSGGFICGGGGGQGVWANGCTQSWGLQVNHKTFEAALSHELIHRFTMNNGWMPDAEHKSSIWAKCDRLNNGSGR